jgi:hypothetical protein
VLGQVAFVDAEQESCPGAPHVEARVREILGMKPDATLEERATLKKEGETLRIIVRRPDGSVLGERTLSAAASCDELEKLVSVVVATWISDLHPEFVATLPPAPANGVMPDDAAPAATTSTVPAAPASESPSSAPPSAPPAPPNQLRPTQRRRWELNAAGGADFSEDGISPVGSLGVRWMPQRLGFGAALTAHAMTPRTEELSMGSVRYWRWPLVAGPALRVPMGSGRFDVHAGAALAWLHAEGLGFTPSETRNLPRGGAVLSMRGAYGPNRYSAFLELNGVLWGKTEAFIDQEDASQSRPLPMVELYATVGASWAL